MKKENKRYYALHILYEGNNKKRYYVEYKSLKSGNFERINVIELRFYPLLTQTFFQILNEWYAEKRRTIREPNWLSDDLRTNIHGIWQQYKAMNARIEDENESYHQRRDKQEQIESEQSSLDSDDKPIYSSQRKKNSNNTKNKKKTPPPRRYLPSKPTSSTKKRKRSNNSASSSKLGDQKREKDHIRKMQHEQLSYSMDPDDNDPFNIRINGKYSIPCLPFSQLDICSFNKKNTMKKINLIFDGKYTTPSKVLRYCNRENLAALLSSTEEPRTWKRPNFVKKMSQYKSRRDKQSGVDLTQFTRPMTEYLSLLCDANIVMILQQNASKDYSCCDRNGNVVKRSKMEISPIVVENYRRCKTISLYDQFYQLAVELRKNKNVNQEIKECKSCKCLLIEDCNWGCNNLYERQSKKRRIT